MQKEYDSFIRQIHNYERSLGIPNIEGPYCTTIIINNPDASVGVLNPPHE